MALFPTCNHTTTHLSNITHCRIYNLTGYCFLPLYSKTERYPAELCPESDTGFEWERIEVGGEKWRGVEEWRRVVYGDMRRGEKGYEEVRRVGDIDLGLGENIGDGELNEKVGFGEKEVISETERLSEKQIGKEQKVRNEKREVRHRRKEPEYYLDSSRAHNFRKAKPAFGNWELIERSELDGYEDFVRAQEQKDNGVVNGDNACSASQEQKKEKKVEWMDQQDGGSLTSLVEFETWDRPRIVGWTLEMEHEAAQFRNKLQ